VDVGPNLRTIMSYAHFYSYCTISFLCEGLCAPWPPLAMVMPNRSQSDGQRAGKHAYYASSA
jgi:hypothetical protein